MFVASVAPAPQFSGLKSLVKSLTGDDKPGEVNGDYEQVPYEVLGKFNVSVRNVRARPRSTEGFCRVTRRGSTPVSCTPALR